MAADSARVLWQIHRRPHGRMLAWIVILGALLGGGSATLVSCLLIDHDPLLATAVGAGLGLFLVLSMLHGSRVRVERGGRLLYALRGHDCVAVDLRRVTAFRQVQTGVLSGIGVEAPLDALEFLSRKGVSRAQCESLQQHQGVALVLEFLLPTDLDPLLVAWQASLAE